MVRKKLAGARLEAQGLEQKLSITQGQLYDARADIRGLSTDNAGLKEMVLATKAEADDWHTKARRRWWVNLVLASALTGVLYLTVAH